MAALRRAGERGEIGVERRGIVGAHEQERRIFRLMAQRIFDREPRLADSAEPMQRLCSERSCAAAQLYRRRDPQQTQSSLRVRQARFDDTLAEASP